MKHEIIIDSKDNELSVHETEDGRKVITIISDRNDPFSLQYIDLEIEDAEWIIARLNSLFDLK